MPLHWLKTNEPKDLLPSLDIMFSLKYQKLQMILL